MPRHWVNTAVWHERGVLSVAKVEIDMQETINRQIKMAQEEIRNTVRRARFVMGSIQVKVEMLERVERSMIRNLSAMVWKPATNSVGSRGHGMIIKKNQVSCNLEAR